MFDPNNLLHSRLTYTVLEIVKIWIFNYLLGFDVEPMTDPFCYDFQYYRYADG